MSLKGVHLIFISASTLLALASMVWCVQQYRETQSLGVLAAGLACTACAVALASYGAWFARVKLGRLP